VKSLKHILGPMRVPFLILAPVCVLLGIGSAVWTAGRVDFINLVLVFIAALAAHISVNSLNEYFDFKSGLDSRTVRTPFSGGSGTLQAAPPMARWALGTGITTMAILGAVGTYFLATRGLSFLPLGLVGMLIIYGYTPWLTRRPFLCLISPGLGFGPLMVMGTQFALTGRYSWTAFVASLVPFFLVNNLLLLNQFPDVDADRSIGRRSLPITLGNRRSSLVYGLFLLLAYLSIVVGVLTGTLPALSLLGLATLPAGVLSFAGAARYAEETPRLIPAMGLNVVTNILTPVLVAVGLLIR